MPPASIKPRILTGDTPTSTGRHLGHYVGSLENRLRLQDDYDCYFLIANVHAFTTLADKPDQIRANTIGIVKDWLAVGLDPERSTFVLQSEVPAIAELTFFFAMLLPFNRVMRNPTLKDEIKVKDLGETYSFGFPLYAVGQTADILAFRPVGVPVGEDQVPHLELTREVARRFNQIFCGVSDQAEDEDHVKLGGVLPIPRAEVGEVGRLVGTDGVNKMSKSLNNAIFISDPASEVEKKIKKIFTGRQSATEPGDVNNALFQYVNTFHSDKARVEELKQKYATGDNIGDGHIKVELAAELNKMLEPMRQRRKQFEGNDEVILDILKKGTARANATAEETLALVKEKANLIAFPRALGFR